MGNARGWLELAEYATTRELDLAPVHQVAEWAADHLPGDHRDVIAAAALELIKAGKSVGQAADLLQSHLDHQLHQN